MDAGPEGIRVSRGAWLKEMSQKVKEPVKEVTIPIYPEGYLECVDCKSRAMLIVKGTSYCREHFNKRNVCGTLI